MANVHEHITQCPECGGPVWDNRQAKRSGERGPKSPDYKCKSCDTRFWLQAGQGTRRGNSNAPPPPAASPAAKMTWAELAAVYAACAKIARHTWQDQPVDMVAATATLFIRAGQIGLSALRTKQQAQPRPQTRPYPAPQQRPRQQAEPQHISQVLPPLDEMPPALEEEVDDDLPF